MAGKSIIGEDGKPVDFTCKNEKFYTNVAKGSPHGESETRGSVFPEPLIQQGTLSLWLEHVKAEDDGNELY